MKPEPDIIFDCVGASGCARNGGECWCPRRIPNARPNAWAHRHELHHQSPPVEMSAAESVLALAWAKAARAKEEKRARTS